MTAAQVPDPILRAVSEEARAALQGRDEVVVAAWPFRIGRESRASTEARPGNFVERRQGRVEPANDLYLIEEASIKFISREHLQIEKVPAGGFQVRDCGSVCGVVVGGTWIGGNRTGGVAPLDFGECLRVGGPESPYEFTFLCAATRATE